MIKITILVLTTLLIFNGCGDGALYTHIAKQDKVSIVHTNDTRDSDNYSSNLVMSMLAKQGGYNTLFISVGNEKSKKMFMVQNSIVKYYNAPLRHLYYTGKRYADTKVTHNIEKYYSPIKMDYEFNTILEFENYLESVEDSSVIYSTGGELYFLSDFIKDPYRLQLVKMKFRYIIFGLGCSTLKPCGKDFNLANSTEAQKATTEVYNKLHNIVPFYVVENNRPNMQTPYNIYKGRGDVMDYIFGNSAYNTYDNIGAGDIEVLLASTRDYPKESGNITWNGKQFRFKKGNGIDKIVYVTDNVYSYLKDVVNYLEEHR